MRHLNPIQAIKETIKTYIIKIHIHFSLQIPKQLTLASCKSQCKLKHKKNLLYKYIVNNNSFNSMNTEKIGVDKILGSIYSARNALVPYDESV